MTAVAKLLPCPFCGYDMSADEDGAYQKAGFIGAQTPVWAVTCAGTDCNASVETTSSERSVAAWNRRAALSPAELGGVEAVGVLSVSKYRGHLENTSFDYTGNLPDGTYYLYTTPRAAEAVTDEMVDSVRADIMQSAANDGRLHIVLKDEWVRAALTAALKGENK